MSTFVINTVVTTPFEGQKLGTSGLRKRVKVFQQEHYTANFVQASLNAMPSPGKKGATLVVGGDGRYYTKEAAQIIIRVAAGNGVSKLIIGRNAILSTPAASNLIRKRHATGGFLLTASHNPGGPDNDFGIKFNVSNGGSAPEKVTDRIYELSKQIKEYHIAGLPEVDLSELGTKRYGEDFTIEVVDSVEDYVQLVKEIFDFELIKQFFQKNPDYKVLFDSLHGVTGPYVKKIFVEELGLPSTSIQNAIPLPDFGGSHPDPNLTYARSLVDRVEKENINFGAASDGDGDRNLIYGKSVFVNPSDSLAVITANAEIIPYFKRTGLKGVARSMPTSGAVDLVAKKKGIECFETPTGWKFFGNLMDAGRISICGEESFGTGSDHIREKDGIWAVLAWLNIIASANEKKPGTGIKEILLAHFNEYGRNFFARYDYEEVEEQQGNNVINHLTKLISTERDSFIGKTYGNFTVKDADNFEYHDPIDGSSSKKQGIRIFFEDGSRIVSRLSGTGSHGATVRLYVEKYSKDPLEYEADTQKALKPLIDVALEISQIPAFTGRNEPTVIT
ncbi:10762_t:CDS:2 [Ambispora gerdemannii]|uniref:phosphoglucomutase (alpha-D-glucose-1,6-bisphosphate-dependent) n=1 Tax=Ambispora gerdemannii TaxID=144530 RepID=A0A9N9FC22_9GLOM|nr:10762_t:CDS:2 [Ambispora gerdemannii]